MTFKLNARKGYSNKNIVGLSIRCPQCNHIGNFDEPDGLHDLTLTMPQVSQRKGTSFFLGHRICPNKACRGHIFVVCDMENEVVASYPAERIDFDPKGVPKEIVEAFEESLDCHAIGCFVAAAMLVRKTLEELCKANGAGTKDDNLKQKIRKLENKVTMPKKLFEGIDNLRLLGNDAAHVDCREYNQIGKDELDVAIDFTKEVLKAVYQYDDLVSKMEALKKGTPPSS